MSEEETLGKLAYEAYMHDAYGHDGSHFRWEDLRKSQRSHWIAAVKAVAERVIAEMQTAEEASE